MLRVAHCREAEAAARRGAAAAEGANPPRADRARGVQRRKGSIRRCDGDEAAARWGAAAAVRAVPPRADRARGVEHRKGEFICVLPIAVTRMRHRAGEDVGEQEEHDSRRRTARQGTARRGAATCGRTNTATGRSRGRAQSDGGPTRTGARAPAAPPLAPCRSSGNDHSTTPCRRTMAFNGGASCDKAQRAQHWQWAGWGRAAHARRGRMH